MGSSHPHSILVTLHYYHYFVVVTFFFVYYVIFETSPILKILSLINCYTLFLSNIDTFQYERRFVRKTTKDLTLAQSSAHVSVYGV